MSRKSVFIVFGLCLPFSSVVFSDGNDYLAPSRMYQHFVLDRSSEKLRTVKNVIDESFFKDLLRVQISNFNNTNHSVARSTSLQECSRDFERVITFSSLGFPWAQKWIDSSFAKPSGLNSGNYMWMGDFDQCLTLPQVVWGAGGRYNFTPRYCYSGIIGLNDTYPIEQMIQQFFFTVMMGVCASNHCGPEEIRGLVDPMLAPSNIKLAAELTYCQIPVDQLEKTDYFYVAITVISTVGVFLLAGFSVDIFLRLHRAFGKNGANVVGKNTIPVISEKQSKTMSGHFAKLLLVFSPITNIEKLLTIPVTNYKTVPNFASVNAIRALSLFWVLLGHFYFYFATIFDNINEVTNYLSLFTFQFVPAGYFAVDTFLFLSGFLAYWSLAKRTSTERFKFWLSLPAIYFYRWLRLAPPFYMAMLFNIGLWRYIGNGPFYFQGTDPFCLRNWWVNLLFLNNFIGVSEQCIGWTWYLSVDMQLFIIVPFLTYLFVKRPKLGWLLAIGIWLVHVGLSVGLTAAYNLPGNPWPPNNYDKMLNGTEPRDFAGQYTIFYVKPYTRMGPYIIGVMASHLLVTNSAFLTRRIFNKPIIQIAGWLVSLTTVFSIIYAQYPIYHGEYLVDLWVDCLYNGFVRSAWGVALSWILLACALNKAGIVGYILNWNLWALPARLSYSAYLIHPFVYLYFVQTSRRPFHTTDISAAYLYSGSVVIVMIVATIYSLCFESPIIAMIK